VIGQGSERRRGQRIARYHQQPRPHRVLGDG
jgi:hypothetical protein